MIQVNENYRIKSDKYCWILETRSDGKTSNGEHKDVWTQTYHPSFEKIAAKIVETEAKLAKSLAEVMSIMDSTAKSIEETMAKGV